MALGRKNVSVARANSGPNIFRLAGLLGDDNLIRHELLASRIGSEPLEHIVNQLASRATFWPFDSWGLHRRLSDELVAGGQPSQARHDDDTQVIYESLVLLCQKPS